MPKAAVKQLAAEGEPAIERDSRLPGSICLTALANQLLDAGQPDPVPLSRHQPAHSRLVGGDQRLNLGRGRALAR